MKTIDQMPIERWPDILGDSLLRHAGPFKRAIVLHETDSTQDAARRMDARVGDVIVAGRQTRGRGRMGRAWADTGDNGVAVTFVMEAARPERLAIACAVDVADALIASMKVTNGWRARKTRVGIKWPNDIIAERSKIAGVLIEQSADRAYVGVGVNVRQASWPVDLQRQAITMAELGFDIDRLLVIDLLMQSVGGMLRRADDELGARFREMDVLTGAICGFRSPNGEIRGKVLRIDPMKGLAVLTDTAQELWLPAATTSVIKD